MQSFGELLGQKDGLLQVEARWREISALPSEMRAPRMQFILDLFLAAHNARTDAQTQEQTQHMLATIFSDSFVHVQLSALNLICSELASNGGAGGSLALQLLPGWCSVSTSASSVRSLMADDICRDLPTAVAALQTMAKLPRQAANLLGKNTPPDVTSLAACVNIFDHVLFDRACAFAGSESQWGDAMAQLLNACGREGIQAIAQCLMERSARQQQQAAALHLLPVDAVEEVFMRLLALVFAGRCDSIAPLQHACRALIAAALEIGERRERLHQLIKRAFLHKHAHYRYVHALLNLFDRCWTECCAGDDPSARARFIQRLLFDISEVWAEPALVRQGHIQRIAVLSRVVCWTLERIGDTEQHILTQVLYDNEAISPAKREAPLSIVCRGISTYFDSTDSTLRRCGMAVALCFARVMKQALTFDDFEDPFSEADKLMESTVASNSPDTESLSTKAHVCATFANDEELRALRDTIFVQKAPDFSNMDELLAFFNPAAAMPERFRPENVLGQTQAMEFTSRSNEYDSDDSELVPFDDAQETEEELRGTPKPRFLRICLDMLRLSPDKEGAFEKHLAALEAIPEILAANPYDAPELAAALLREVLRIENHAHEANAFSSARSATMLALCVAQPAATVDTLTAAVQDKEYSLGTRIEVLSCMMATANNLASGSTTSSSGVGAEGDDRNDTGSNPRVGGLPSDMKVVQSRRKRTMRQPAKTVRNMFAPVAFRFFYPVMHAFIAALNLTLPRNVQQSTLASRALTTVSDFVQSPLMLSAEDQAALAVHLLTALTEFVRCCVPLAEAQVMARDLSALLAQLDVPADVGLRRAVMLAWYTCVMSLGEHVDSLTVDRCIRVARIQLENDPDPQARAITQGVVREILGVIDPHNLMT